ncbi:HD domain-containing protein [Ferviditalea candida]|uniref:HD domain-containing protein n=1 Tax=Ferviditalea candida TaxID=3108399 RepID=A0ABU5ZJK6_9BACL|nr:HD domain-containing protein [Paenibacillaceae bacterium T2]
MNIIDKAIQTATIAHANQTRKSSDLPYITHVYGVGILLAQHGCSPEEIAAGILHDTVEDTDLTLEDIKKDFGEQVAAIVEGCSEPGKSLSWEKRKEHTLEFLKHASDEIRHVACADKLHNIRSMREDYSNLGESLWTRFKRGKEQQAWYYSGLVISLSVGAPFPMLDELKVEVERLFG